MRKAGRIEIDGCTDKRIIGLAAQTCASLLGHNRVLTAVVVLTSNCPEEQHGIHVTRAVLNRTGTMSAREARHAVEKLRLLADELESRFDSLGSGN
jgi:hypothetical protein